MPPAPPSRSVPSARAPHTRSPTTGRPRGAAAARAHRAPDLRRLGGDARARPRATRHPRATWRAPAGRVHMRTSTPPAVSWRAGRLAGATGLWRRTPPALAPRHQAQPVRAPQLVRGGRRAHQVSRCATSRAPSTRRRRGASTGWPSSERASRTPRDDVRGRRVSWRRACVERDHLQVGAPTQGVQVRDAAKQVVPGAQQAQGGEPPIRKGSRGGCATRRDARGRARRASARRPGRTAGSRPDAPLDASCAVGVALRTALNVTGRASRAESARASNGRGGSNAKRTRGRPGRARVIEGRACAVGAS